MLTEICMLIMFLVVTYVRLNVKHSKNYIIIVLKYLTKLKLKSTMEKISHVVMLVVPI